MFTVERFHFEDAALYKTSLEIRRLVFIEEQAVSEEIEIEFEEEAKYYLLLKDGKAIATARRRKTNKGIKLERFAMLKAHRNKGHGSVLLKAVLDDISDEKDMVYLHAQLPAVNYYARYGFRISGDVFSEADIDHYLMTLQK